MNESIDIYKDLLEKILANPAKEKAVKTAHEITDIVFNIRQEAIFPEIFDQNNGQSGELIKPQIVPGLCELFKSFRAEISILLSEDITLPDNKLYSEIIVPLILIQLDQAI